MFGPLIVFPCTVLRNVYHGISGEDSMEELHVIIRKENDRDIERARLHIAPFVM